MTAALRADAMAAMMDLQTAELKAVQKAGYSVARSVARTETRTAVQTVAPKGNLSVGTRAVRWAESWVVSKAAMTAA